MTLADLKSSPAEIAISKFGIGTWSMAGANWKYGWGPQTEKDSKETIELALDGDINLFDTAPSYLSLIHISEPTRPY